MAPPWAYHPIVGANPTRASQEGEERRWHRRSSLALADTRRLPANECLGAVSCPKSDYTQGVCYCLATSQWLVAQPPTGALLDHPLHAGRVGQLPGGVPVVDSAR